MATKKSDKTDSPSDAASPKDAQPESKSGFTKRVTQTEQDVINEQAAAMEKEREANAKQAQEDREAELKRRAELIASEGKQVFQEKPEGVLPESSGPVPTVEAEPVDLRAAQHGVDPLKG